MEGNTIVNLFTPYRIKDMELKNRIVMSPMCMYSSDDTGTANNWHYHHLLSRAIGGTGLIIQEATAVLPEGRITHADLGIWHDKHIPALEKIVHAVQAYGAKIGIQLAHAGRKATVGGTIYAPSPIPYDESYKTPHDMTKKDILETIQAFKRGAERAKKAGYDLIEIHAAHGYLINSFLSPLTNKRYDEYGGSYWNRFRFLEQIIEEVTSIWDGPLFVRISAEDYHKDGYHPSDYVDYAMRMKEMGVDLVDCSSGAVAPAKIDTFPGYQVTYAEIIKQGAHIPTGAVGLITSFDHADEIIRNGRSDLVFLGRVLLREPYWALKAAHYFNVDVDSPVQYERAFSTGRTSS